MFNSKIHSLLRCPFQPKKLMPKKLTPNRLVFNQLIPNYGQSLVEVVVALAIFALLAAAIVTLAAGSFIGLNKGGEQTQAEAFAEEGIEAVRAIHDRAWNELIYSPAKISAAGNQWGLISTPSELIDNKYTRTITFSDVCRNSSNDIADCPGTYTDVHSKRVTVKVEWTAGPSVTNMVQRIAYLTNWDSREWIEDVVNDFSDGTVFNTEVSPTLGDGDGAVVLLAQ